MTKRAGSKAIWNGSFKGGKMKNLKPTVIARPRFKVRPKQSPLLDCFVGPLVLLAVTILLLPTILYAASNVIQIKGSDTMVNLGQGWAEEYMHQHPQVSIAVTGGGSGTGIAALINGTTNIAQSSRDMKPEEKEEVRKATGKGVKEFKVGMDALAVIVHPENPISELSIDQLSDIFTGKVTNWKDVGGPDKAILVLSREKNSGTHVYFLEHVVRKGNAKGPEEFGTNVLMMPSSQAIAQEVSRSQAAIGYLGLGYVGKGHKPLLIKKGPNGSAVGPSVETAQNGTYPISRPLYIYTAGEPEGEVKAFIDFAMSPEGQEIVRVMDFVPLND